MYISPWPGITPRDWLRTPRSRGLPYPLSAERRLSFYVASNGIYHLFRALDLKPTDSVLVPDYHSGNEVSAMLAAGANLVYYPIRRNLEPDLEALSRLARRLNPRVIYVIHYLGWAQPMTGIESLARQSGSIIVEDCALSLLSESNGAPLGSCGDFAIFCLYKTLPVPNGGLLIQNRVPLPALAAVTTEPSPRLAVVGRTLELTLEALRSRGDRTGNLLFDAKQSIGRALRRKGVRHVPVGDIGWTPANLRLGMSELSDRLARSFDHASIRARRRDNFLSLRAMLPEAIPLRHDLPEGACPLFFPILVDDKAAVAKALQARGISAVEFWNDEHPHAAPHSGEDSRFLRTHLIELPIHQDVRPAQLGYMTEQFQRLAIRPMIHAEPAIC